MFIKLNLKNAYHCIRIKKENKWKTVFCIYYSHFKYIIMSFKLINVFVKSEHHTNSTAIVSYIFNTFSNS